MAKELSYEALLPALNGLKVRCMTQTELGWIVEAEGPPRAICPDCGATSRSRHSRYWRKLRDLPLQGATVTIKLLLGRWRCRRKECTRKIFTERVAGVLLPYSQHTIRLTEVHRLVGRALGGRSGERLLNRLGMPSSRHTLLREVIRGARGAASQPTVRILGVDDWAWSKGQSFGTILENLERSEVVDLLPTRSAHALSEWLANHPQVMVVSRDRQGSYAQGARSTAPEAVQVADRFHLTFNLRQAVERELAVRRPFLLFTPLSIPAIAPRPDGGKKNRQNKIQVRSSVKKQDAESTRLRRQQQLELFQTIHRLKATGMTATEIADHLGLNRRRIDRWLRLDTLPERNRMEQERWDTGCRHGRTLFAEIQALGYIGAFSRLANLLSPWRQPPPLEPAPASAEATPQEETNRPTAARQISPQVAAALLTKFRSDLTPQQEEIVDTLKQHCPDFAAMRELVLSFRNVLRLGKLIGLHSWIERAQNSGIHAMMRFVRSLKQDLSAIEAAVTEPWSNGPVEGQINRLKTLKRQMYGRAGIELLRARLLPEIFGLPQDLHQT